jgi:4-alpha-glucanotransferase
LPVVKTSEKKKRASGLLLHITSLPSKYGIGDMGPEAYKFADFLKKAKQKFWQVLPLNPPSRKSGNSPYNCSSAFAGNPLLISPQFLFQQGILNKKEISQKAGFDNKKTNYRLAVSYKRKLFKMGFQRFQNKNHIKDFKRFCSSNDFWLNDYALFMAMQCHFKERLWCDWPGKFRDHDRIDIEPVKRELAKQIEYEKFLQYLFFTQYRQLKKYCNDIGIQIIGDIPIYLALDSADVWSHPENFKLTRSKRPQYISGVPPDLFSIKGQLWNNPVYDWQKLKKNGYRWWIQRIKHNLELFDVVRIDHFRGLVAYWQLPAGSKTAVNGKWIKGPGDDFFKTIFKNVNLSSIIAEDLGYITSNVKKYIKKYRLTGMSVLQFGFGRNCLQSPHFPDNIKQNSIAYTGTHDNNTIKGWFKKEITPQARNRIFDFLGHKTAPGQIHWQLINTAMNSSARLVIIPVQDILGLGSESRMNHPGKSRGNWQWKLRTGQLTSKLSSKLATLTQKHNRT